MEIEKKGNEISRMGNPSLFFLVNKEFISTDFDSISLCIENFREENCLNESWKT